MSDERLLIISPVRNEAAHIERVANALAAQSRPPALWLVVDDESEDATPQILRRLAAEIDFMEVTSAPDGLTPRTADRLAVAAAPRAFNHGLRTVGARALSSFTHIGKLDGDVELRPEYYEAILGEFGRNPRLGIAGGVILENDDGEWRPTPSASAHVRGALKLYSSTCFEAIEGVRERLAWDAIDEILARMRGFETRSFAHAEALHHRRTGSADGSLRGHVRWGQGHWITHHGVAWTVLRAARITTSRPRGVSGLAYLYGYAQAAVRRVPRVEIEGYRRFVRAEQRRRARESLLRLARPVGSWQATKYERRPIP
jgi:glycosyltransferase involved in cell wall biosynthesis